MNKNFTIPAFAEPITGLPDTPTCAANELKRRFQAPADEVRTAHNALAEAHETLDEKVAGIIAETFEGIIDKTMLAPEFVEEVDAKATQDALSAEETARQSADETLSSRMNSLESKTNQKCEVVFGSYTGTGTYPRTIYLGFTPKAVLIGHQNGLIGDTTAVYSTLMLNGYNTSYCGIVSEGFTLYDYDYSHLNYNAAQFFYIAFK